MKISEVVGFLESIAPPSLQESYDNNGLLIGESRWDCSGILCALDVTEILLQEALDKGCNLVVAHHPVIFGGLKRINATTYTERAIVFAIKHDIAIYAIHTNLDNLLSGVSGRMAQQLGLEQVKILSPRNATLKKLVCFAPVKQAEAIRESLFGAGAGQIGQYSECSFNVEGKGSFTAGQGANPFSGTIGRRQEEEEVRVEVILPAHLEIAVVRAMRSAHPYEEPAYDIIPISNTHPEIGSGVIGLLPQPMGELSFIDKVKQAFGATVLRHTRLTGKMIQRVALCGGAGSFLINKALSAGADAYITADLKYHEFFDANDRILLGDIGHYESEQYTITLLQEVLEEKFPTFAVLKTGILTNPVLYS